MPSAAEAEAGFQQWGAHPSPCAPRFCLPIPGSLLGPQPYSTSYPTRASAVWPVGTNTGEQGRARFQQLHGADKSPQAAPPGMEHAHTPPVWEATAPAACCPVRSVLKCRWEGAG